MLVLRVDLIMCACFACGSGHLLRQCFCCLLDLLDCGSVRKHTNAHGKRRQCAEAFGGSQRHCQLGHSREGAWATENDGLVSALLVFPMAVPLGGGSCIGSSCAVPLVVICVHQPSKVQRDMLWWPGGCDATRRRKCQQQAPAAEIACAC